MDAPTKHRKERSNLLKTLNIDAEEIESRKQFLQFHDDDAQRLQDIGGLADRYADEVIEEFYRHLLSFEETRIFFNDPETLSRVKNAQKNYFLRLTQGNYGPDYIENRLRVGSVHERISLPVKAYLGMYNFYLRSVFARLTETYRDDPARANDIFVSLMKLTFLDIGLAIDTYIDSRERTIGQQQDAIKELSTPVLPFREGILLLPVIGMIDSYRASQLTEQLLHSIRDTRAKVVVVDITGVPYVDSRVASHLVQTVEAARLMGSKVIVSGVSPEIALTMVTLGIDLGRIETVGDMQSGLERAEQLSGYKMVRVDPGPGHEQDFGKE
ncbi:protoglobin domain-containing protein [Noviherbaspirillum denitrificans]|uniref:protoglobin domain-containing protein n=1 Tax=Noviherbaspirillum denitrificans TaxID=1968433 RepID=UPI000B531FF1|nr:protoglobin domain-containing protein [Noviherbaspirillum denitrificans]